MPGVILSLEQHMVVTVNFSVR